MANCDNCDHKDDKVSKPHRRQVFDCGVCNRSLCNDCLKEMAVTHNLLSEGDAAKITELVTFHCEETDEKMCAECFEAEE